MSTTGLDILRTIHLGRMPYGLALEQQTSWHQKVQNGAPSVILTVEHDPVLTLGKNSDPGHLLLSRRSYSDMGVELFETERGGEVTAHMPGQLVVYPIIDVLKFKLTVRQYINALEQSVIDTLKDYGVIASTDANLPGVWVAGDKICAIGVRVKSRITMHGLALNINNETDLFQKIVPCGIKARGVTTLSKQVERRLDVNAVRDVLLRHLKRQLLDD
jgi:lipoate-protein ligase B